MDRQAPGPAPRQQARLPRTDTSNAGQVLTPMSPDERLIKVAQLAEQLPKSSYFQS